MAGEGQENDRESLGVADLKDEFGTSVEILVVGLDLLLGLPRVQGELSVVAALKLDMHEVQEERHVRREQLEDNGEADRIADDQEPSLVKFLERSDENVGD